jgi:hypothetical protein
MASQPLVPHTLTCHFRKENGEFCKRSVSSGEGMCWQHAKTWRHRIKSLTRNQTVIFMLTIVGVIIGVPSLYFSYISYIRPPNVPSPAPMEQSPILKVDVVGIMIPSFMWLVRSDVKQYFPADMFVLMRFTNLTKEEILVESLNVETIGKVSIPLTLFPLDADERWRMYCGPSTTFVVPCSVVNTGFLLDVLRQPIAAGRTVYSVGLFQVPQGKGFSPGDLSGLTLHIIDMRSRRYDIRAIIPTEWDPGSLERSTIQNSHPPINISAYSEQRPLYP